MGARVTPGPHFYSVCTILLVQQYRSRVFSLDSRDPTPLHAQLERSIRAEIAAGRLRAGDRLPTVRRLAKELGINPNTVGKVYSSLEQERVLATRRGVGTFVREPLAVGVAEPDVVERDRILHHLANRILAEAHASGLTIDDVIRYLESRSSRTS